MSDNTRTLVVLGSADPEMREIEQLAIKAGCSVLQAKSGGQPVRPGCQPDKEGIDEICKKMLEIKADTVLLVEQPGRSSDNVLNNQGSWYLEAYGTTDNWPVAFVEIDHHDPAKVWPEDMPLWKRSSLGQLAGHLGVELDERQRWIGALDHDLPGALNAAHLESRLDFVLDVYCSGAAHLFGGVPPEVYKQQAYDTYYTLTQLGTVPFGAEGEKVVPVFRLPPDPSTAGATGEHYPLPALPLALAMAGLAGLSIIRRKDGILAWRLQCASPSQVRHFLGEHFHGLQAVQPGTQPPNAPYGVPERGFAGGVVSQEWIAVYPARYWPEGLLLKWSPC